MRGRSVSRVRHVTLACLLAAALVARPLGATEEAVPVRWSLEAPAGCDDASAFGAALLGRTRRGRRAESDEEAMVVTAVIEPRGDAWTGRLQVLQSAAAPSERSVVGARCEEVRDALAFIAALSIDAQSEDAVERKDGSLAEEAEATDASEEALVEPSRPPEESPVPPPATPESEPLPARTWWLGAEAVVATPFGDANAFGASVFARWMSMDPGWLALDLRLGLRGLSQGGFTVPEGAAVLHVVGGVVEVCPVRLLSEPDVRVPVCVETEVGAIVGEGRGVDDPVTEARPWLAPGASLRLQGFPMDELAVELGAGLAVPATRHRYRFEPDVELGRINPIQLRLSAGLAWRVW